MKKKQGDTAVFRHVKKNLPADVAVLGAGIMGSCLALELGRRGYQVDLIDRAAFPMSGASLHNEGKLHLGFVYANDPSRETHRIMLQGSLSFARIIGELTGCGLDSFGSSEPFQYFVPRDSQLGINAIENHFHAVEEAARDITRSSGDLYLGCRIERYYERNSPACHASLFAPDRTLGSFRTEERSVPPAVVAGILCQSIRNHPNINFIERTDVRAVHRLSSGDVEVESRRGSETILNKYASVANCLWDDKLRIDSTAGVNTPGPWLLRYKATIMVTALASEFRGIPSATGILGRYGDVVNFGSGSYYISWYPRCKVAQTIDENGRGLHDMVHTGIASRFLRKVIAGFPEIACFVSSLSHKKFIGENIREMASYIPSMTCLLTGRTSARLGGGVIMAKGATDIDDPESYLHQRSAIGPEAYGSYVTINTGKYCTAPLFALQAADMIENLL